MVSEASGDVIGGSQGRRLGPYPALGAVSAGDVAQCVYPRKLGREV